MIQSVIEADVPQTAVPPAEEACPDLEGPCNEALKLFSRAKRPLIIVGGGVILGKASEAFRSFVRKLQIPVASTLMGLGAFPGADPLWTGMVGMHGAYYANMAVSQCDVLMAVGVRFDDRVTSKVSAFAPHARLIHIDIDPVSIDKVIRADVSMVCHCGPALKTLNRLIDEQGLTLPKSQIRYWHRQLRQWKAEMPLGYCSNRNIKPQYVVEKLRPGAKALKPRTCADYLSMVQGKTAPQPSDTSQNRGRAVKT